MPSRNSSGSKTPARQPTVVEARAFCKAFFYAMLKDISRDAKVDVREFYRASRDPRTVEQVEGVKLSDDHKSEMARMVGYVQKALADAYAAREAMPVRPKKLKPPPGLPPGWRFADPQEVRPQRTNSTDYSVASPILARRGRRRLVFRPSVKIWGGIGCDRETWNATLSLYDPDRPYPNETDLHEGRLSAKVFEAHIEAIRQFLDAPELQAAWLDRNRTIVIDDPADETTVREVAEDRRRDGRGRR